jgi:hypothetical protein
VLNALCIDPPASARAAYAAWQEHSDWDKNGLGNAIWRDYCDRPRSQPAGGVAPADGPPS